MLQNPDPKGGWTTQVPDYRSGGQVGTHQRYRHYWVDGLMTLVLALKTEDELHQPSSRGYPTSCPSVVPCDARLACQPVLFSTHIHP